MVATVKMRLSSSWKLFGFLAFVVPTIAQGYVPTFDEVNRIQVLFLPKDISVGTAIYRFQASDADRDYPLIFGINSRQPQDIIRMKSVSETEADAVLLRPLQSGVIYNVTIFVQDKSGQSTEIDFRINVTDARSTSDNVFIQYNTTNSIKESASVNATVCFVMARSNDYNYRQVDLKLKGSDKFKIFPILESDKIIRGNIILTSPLDYEKQNFYELTVVASNGYIERSVDTRNIVYLSIFIVVEDEQDAPPVFTELPSVVRIPSDLKIGGRILHAKAEDGDTANRRAIKYSILPGPESQYFKIDASGGDIVLAQAASEITQANGGAPVILTVQAEEVGDAGSTPAQSRTTRDVVVLLGTRESQAPVFEVEHYEGVIEEHAPAFSIVTLDKKTRVSDDDQGTAGVFTLHIEDVIDGQMVERILEIDPPVIVRDGEFSIKVKNSELLDYEQFKEVGLQFKIVAREISEDPLSSSATVTVHIKDINDNFPVFSKSLYEASIPEDIKAGTFVAKIVATDADSGESGQIIYTGLSGEIADKFNLDPNTGVITAATSAHGFDRELKQEYDILVEASDKGNPANHNTTSLRIKLLDVNDHAPQFREGVYETVLAPDIPLSGPFLRVEAIDQDEPGTNNSIVRYEILSGNRGDTFEINRSTGELRLKKNPTVTARQVQQGALLDDNDDEDTSYILIIRAYDLGVPHQSSTATVHVYFKNNPGFMNGTILYVYPASVNDVNHDFERIERLLTKLNGANTVIVGMAPYIENSVDFTQARTPAEKTLIRTSVRYHKQSIVNLADVARELNVSAVDTAGANNRLETAGTSEGWKIALIIILVILSIVLMILLCFCLHRYCRKMDERKVHPTEVKPDDKNRSQIIEVATLENGFRDGRYAGTSNYHSDKMAAKTNGHHNSKDSEDTDTVAAMNVNNKRGPNVDDRRPSAGGLQRHRSRTQPQVTYSRHLHGQDSQSLKEGATGTAGNNVHQHAGHHPDQDHQHADDVLELDEEEVAISHPQRAAAQTRPQKHDAPHHHQPPPREAAAGYRMAPDRLEASYVDGIDLDNEIEEIIVIEPDQGQGHYKGPALRRVRRIVKRSPARGQEPVYRHEQATEEWVPMPVPEWLGKLPTEYLEEYEDDEGDPYGDYGARGRAAAARGRGGVDGVGQVKRIKVRKYKGEGGGGSLPGDRLAEDRTRDGRVLGIEDLDELEDGEGYSPPKIRFQERPKHSTLRGRALTRASFRVVDDDDSDNEMSFRRSPHRRTLADVETNEQYADGREHTKHVRTGRLDSGNDEDESDLETGEDGVLKRRKAKMSRDRSKSGGDDTGKDGEQTENAINAASQTVELDSKCTQTQSASQTRTQPTDETLQQVGGTTDAKGEFDFLLADKDEQNRPDQEEGATTKKRKNARLSTQASLQTPHSTQSDSTPLSQGSQGKKSITPGGRHKPYKPGKGKGESRYMDWYHNKNSEFSGSFSTKGSEKHKPSGGGGGGSSVDTKTTTSTVPIGGSTVADKLVAAANGDETIPDETTSVRRRGSDSVMVNGDQRRQLMLHQNGHEAVIPLAMNGAPDSTSAPVAAVEDTQRRSGTALDAMEAEIRLGGNPFVAEDDEDSGIGHTDSFKSSKKQFLEKRSLFTIAYNGMQNKQDALKDREPSAGAHKIT